MFKQNSNKETLRNSTDIRRSLRWLGLGGCQRAGLRTSTHIGSYSSRSACGGFFLTRFRKWRMYYNALFNKPYLRPTDNISTTAPAGQQPVLAALQGCLGRAVGQKKQTARNQRKAILVPECKHVPDWPTSVPYTKLAPTTMPQRRLKRSCYSYRSLNQPHAMSQSIWRYLKPGEYGVEGQRGVDRTRALLSKSFLQG